MGTAVAGGQINFVMLAETILVPNGSEDGTHRFKSGKDFFYIRRIIGKMCTVKANQICLGNFC